MQEPQKQPRQRATFEMFELALFCFIYQICIECIHAYTIYDKKKMGDYTNFHTILNHKHTKL